MNRNHLVKFIKQPPENGEFKAISVYLDQDTLRHFSLEYGYKAVKQHSGDAVMTLKPDILYKSYMESLMPYLQTKQPVNANLQSFGCSKEGCGKPIRKRQSPFGCIPRPRV